MKVSIVTVCLNSAATIKDCLDSIVGQKYKNIESIIIDGGSADETLAIVNNYKTLTGFKGTFPGLGIYDAMNKGLEMATGDIVGILNSDDLLMDEMAIQSIVDGFLENPEAPSVYGDLVYVDVKKIDKITRYWEAGNFSSNKMKMGWMPPHPTFYVKKPFLDIIGKYRTDLGTAGDYEFILRAIFKNNLVPHYIPKVLVKMRRGGVSNGSLFRRFKANRNDRLAWAVNGLHPFPLFGILKPLRKIFQYVKRPKI